MYKTAFFRDSTTYLHLAALIGGGNLKKVRQRTFEKIVIYATNTDPSSHSNGLFEGNFLQLWKSTVFTHSSTKSDNEFQRTTII